MAGRRNISWGRISRAKLHNLVERRNAVLDVWSERSFDEIPQRLTEQQLQRSLQTPQDMRDFEIEIEAMESETADIPVYFRGKIMPEFMAEQIEKLENDIDAAHLQRREKLYANWESMSELSRSIAKTKASIEKLGKTEASSEYLTALEEQLRSERESHYIANYEAEWTKYCLVPNKREKVLNDIEYIADNYPDAIQDVLDIGFKEAQIEYIYEDSTYKEETRTRHNRVVDFWHDLRLHLDSGEAALTFEPEEW